ncbi:hypothetical protein [Streptomyces sp. NPDC023838]|uniref:hypothetical protein n=1 Tax=Streptomyces sp. NPDC023838 TaxID=3154325 RepID=UPI0033C4880A
MSAAVAVCAVTAALPGAASAEPTAVAGVAGGLGADVEKISVAPDGTQSDDNSAGASITPDGRHIWRTGQRMQGSLNQRPCCSSSLSLRR